MAQSAHNRYALGVDIGGSHVCSAVVDLATGQLCGEPHTDKVDAVSYTHLTLPTTPYV